MKSILVIDDDLTNVSLLKARLSKEGYFVIGLQDAEKALYFLKDSQPGLIILDVEMPGMDGYSFLVSLDKLGLPKPVPVIVVTSHQETQPIFKMRGVRDYLLKPVNFEELLPKVQKYFA